MKKILCLISLLLVFSCAENSKRPDVLLSENQMAEVLTELYTIQQSHYLSELNQADIDISKMDVGVLQKHGTTAEEFKENYHYYYLQPDKFKDILTRVRDNLEEMLPEKERKERQEQRANINKNNPFP